MIGVIGAGTMGNGIAQVFAAKGHDVVLCDLNGDALARGARAAREQLPTWAQACSRFDAQLRAIG